MKINHLHSWYVSPPDAIALQNKLADKVIQNPPLDISKVKLVGGVDVSVNNNISTAAVVILKFPELEVIETVFAQQATAYPYIPGLLTFREGPVLEEAFLQLKNVPDVFIFDGMGRIHPRKMGIATHMGLWLEHPTIGCGKTHFVGKYDQPAPEKGSYTPLFYKKEQLGVVLRTRDKVKPVYISVGHLIDLDSAIELVMACTPKYRLPTPVREAHIAAGKS